MSSTDGRRSLVIYLVCEPETAELAEAAVEGGADLIELGFPFSDPLAEGPTIRLASERALARGMRTAQCLDCIAEVRRRVDVPLVPMTYAAILEAYGYERFAACAAASGGWLYLVALTGTTGARYEVSPALAGLVERARALTEKPLY